MALELAHAEVIVDRRPDGTVVLQNAIELAAVPRCLSDVLEAAADEAPHATFLAERDHGGEVCELSYASAWAKVQALAGALLDRGLEPGRPLMILAPNSIDHALITFAAMHVGIPVAPISLAYALAGGTSRFERLRAVVEVLEPQALHFTPQVESATSAVAEALGRAPVALDASFVQSTSASTPSDRVAELAANVGPASTAKILFTSGSTGEPKGVINTQRMLCSNQVALRQLWPFLARQAPVLVDWLPWNHTFGSNFDTGMVLFNRGMLFIDEGKPTPQLVGRSVANLKACAPTVYVNVPRGFDAVLPHLESDDKFARHFFSRLQAVFYAGAALPQSTWSRLEQLAHRVGVELPFMCSGWGSTETAPCSTLVHTRIERAGVIGNPLPGTEVMLRPDAEKFELRVRGPNVTPGYWNAPHLNASAFDDEGFYRIGDAGKLEDPAVPEAGICFDGRVAEDFKLTSGTWVRVGALRLALVAAASPLVADAFITGHDRDEVGALLFLSLDAAREFVGDTQASALTLAGHVAVRAHILDALRRHNGEARGSSTRVARALLSSHAASLDAGEITDKGYLVQRTLLRTRSEQVERIHAHEPDADVFVP